MSDESKVENSIDLQFGGCSVMSGYRTIEPAYFRLAAPSGPDLTPDYGAWKGRQFFSASARHCWSFSISARTSFSPRSNGSPCEPTAIRQIAEPSYQTSRRSSENSCGGIGFSQLVAYIKAISSDSLPQSSRSITAALGCGFNPSMQRKR